MELNNANTVPDDIEALKAALIAAQLHVADAESKFAIVSGERDAVASELAADALSAVTIRR